MPGKFRGIELTPNSFDSWLILIRKLGTVPLSPESFLDFLDILSGR
jgi:hypothetical protein